MKLLQVISLLLDYPTETLQKAHVELKAEISQTRYICPQQRQDLHGLVDSIQQMELLEAEATYLDTFENGRRMSLFLFEHVHGESRDRGQAMVDLLNQYQAAGFEISAKELPDYIPLYLEYLATQPLETALEGLMDIQHLLVLLAARLEQKNSPYFACLQALVQLTGQDPQTAIQTLETDISQENSQQSMAELDELWEEEAVSFMGDQATASCSTTQQKTLADGSIPIHWADFKRSEPSLQNT